MTERHLFDVFAKVYHCEFRNDARMKSTACGTTRRNSLYSTSRSIVDWIAEEESLLYPTTLEEDMASVDHRAPASAVLNRGFPLILVLPSQSSFGVEPGSVQKQNIGPVGLHIARGPRAAKLVVATVRSVACSNSLSLSTARAAKAPDT